MTTHRGIGVFADSEVKLHIDLPSCEYSQRCCAVPAGQGLFLR